MKSGREPPACHKLMLFGKVYIYIYIYISIHNSRTRARASRTSGGLLASKTIEKTGVGATGASKWLSRSHRSLEMSVLEPLEPRNGYPGATGASWSLRSLLMVVPCPCDPIASPCTERSNGCDVKSI